MENKQPKNKNLLDPAQGQEPTIVPVSPKKSFLHVYGEIIEPIDIIKAAQNLGVIKRQRKVDIPALVEASITAMSPQDGNQTTIFSNYLSLTGQKLAPSAFYDRFSPEFAQLIQQLAGRAVTAVRELTGDERYVGEFGLLLDYFDDVRIADSTCYILKKLAKDWAPSTSKKRPAGIKLHTVISLKNTLPMAGSITAQKTHDNKGFPEQTLEPGTLMLFDLGYIDVSRFIEATQQGAFFITRLKSTHDPEIVRVYQGKGSRLAARGLRIHDAIASGILETKAGALDLDVRISDGKQEAVVRVVAIDDPTGEQHFYICNVPRQWLSPHDISETYRLRWIVELMYKHMKSGLGFSAIRAWRPDAIKALIYSKIIALCLARLLELSVEEQEGPNATTQLAIVLALSRAIPLLLSVSYMRRGIDIATMEERILLIASTIARSRNKRRERKKREDRENIGFS